MVPEAVRAVILDLDGTLLDTGGPFINCMVIYSTIFASPFLPFQTYMGRLSMVCPPMPQRAWCWEWRALFWRAMEAN